MFGERLKKLRKIKNRTQDQVATDLKLTRAQYSHFENNRNEPDQETLVKLADYYGVTTDYLLGRKVDDDLLVAAHMDDDLTPDQRKEIEEYIEFKKAQYRKEHEKD